MVILHKDGTIVELSQIEKVRPLDVNKVTGLRNVEIRFTSGITDNFSDFWFTKTDNGVSIYDILVSEKFKINWKDVVKP
jgi:hypothetical protein